MTRASHKDWHSKEQLEKLQGWARDGLTDGQIASNVGCSRSTLNEWKRRYSDISDALKKGKHIVDVEVENSLLKKAMGTTTKTTQYKMVKVDADVLKAKRVKFMNTYKLGHPDKTREEIVIAAALAIPTYERIPIVETVQEVPPDTKAAIFWLKNRMPEKYRDQTFRRLNEAQADKTEAEVKRIEAETKRLESGEEGLTKIVFTDDLKPDKENDTDQKGDEGNGKDTKPK